MNTYPLLDASDTKTINHLRAAEWRRKMAVRSLDKDRKFPLRLVRAA